MSRIIKCQVDNEYIRGGGVVIGSEGSGESVTLELAFNSAWDGYTKRLIWYDALGEHHVVLVLTADQLVSGTNVYQVPIPAEACAVAGDAMLTIRGVTVDQDTGNTLSCLVGATVTFRVLEGKWTAILQDMTSSQAEQLQAQIDALLPKIVLAGQAAENETERIAAEQARADAEAERVAAEQARADENAGIVAQATEKAVEAASSAASAASSAADAESSAEQASASESAAADSKKTAGAAADSACADRLEAQYIARVIQHGQLPTDLPTNLILEAGKAVTYSATDTEPYTVPTVAKSLELGRRYQVLISGTVYAEFLWTGKTVYVRKESAEPGTYLVSVSGEMSYDQTTYKLTLQNGTMGFAPNSGRSLTVTLKAVDDSALPPVSQGIELDNTLTKEGKAADAAAVGDALSTLSEEIANIPTGGAPVSDLKSILTNIVTFLKSVPFDDTVASASDLDAIQSKIDALGSGGGSEEPTETVSATFSDGVLTISGATVNSATFTGGVLAVG